MIRWKKRFSLIGVASLLIAPAVSAQPAKPSRAEILFREGREAKARNDMVTACAKFEESVSLTRAPGAILNLAVCEEQKSHLVSALKLWNEGIGALPARDERLAPSKERAAALMKSIPKLSIRVEPQTEAVQIEIDGESVPANEANSPRPVDPGRHKVSAKSGDRSGETSVTVTLGEQKEVTVTLRESAKKEGSSNKLRTAGFVVGGVGALGLVTFAVTAGIIQGYRGTLEKECDAQKQCTPAGIDAVSSGQTLTPINAAALIVGAVGVSAGVTLVLLGAPKSPAQPSAAIRASGMPGGFAASVVGTF